ncbi:HutD family protein [Sphingomonas sp. PL-96]|uniref:HutD/Ves family protein n=1 Tax=Sphingomonas sp. PL-96 TaxID=2887201 RepID=UPI001E630984|nr:HutD family protein [Sphingomonas sp. PL-96]MCC2975919.1 HutD family protein [Sphingomonas sp. PL-96]
MSIGRILQAADCRETAWKNGVGTTREIAVFPPAAVAGDFLWRLSLAKVEVEGAFSTFAGVDRVLAIVQGSLRLVGPTGGLVLHEGRGVHAFDGGVPLRGEPSEGGALVLNAMTRSGSYRASIKWLGAGDTVQARGATFLFVLEDQRLGEVDLRRLDCLMLDCAIKVSGVALLVTFARR